MDDSSVTYTNVTFLLFSGLKKKLMCPFLIEDIVEAAIGSKNP
jgi:hypothetical protein